MVAVTAVTVSFVAWKNKTETLASPLSHQPSPTHAPFPAAETGPETPWPHLLLPLDWDWALSRVQVWVCVLVLVQVQVWAPFPWLTLRSSHQYQVSSSASLAQSVAPPPVLATLSTMAGGVPPPYLGDGVAPSSCLKVWPQTLMLKVLPCLHTEALTLPPTSPHPA